MLSGCTPRPRLNAKQMAAPKYSWSGSNYKGNPPWNDMVLRKKTPSVGQNTMLTFHSANWKLTFGSIELFTADVLHGLAVRRKVGVGGGGISGDEVRLWLWLWASPLFPLTSPGLTAADRAFTANLFQCISFPSLLFKAETLLNDHQPYSVISKHGGDHFHLIRSAKQNASHFFIAFWNPNINESKFSVFSPGLLHSYK